jgi:hypothetical protein
MASARVRGQENAHDGVRFQGVRARPALVRVTTLVGVTTQAEPSAVFGAACAFHTEALAGETAVAGSAAILFTTAPLETMPAFIGKATQVYLMEAPSQFTAAPAAVTGPKSPPNKISSVTTKVP